VQRCIAEAAGGGPVVTVAPFSPRRVGLVQTHLPGLKASVYRKAEQVTQARLARLGCPLVRNIPCDHNRDAVAAALADLRADGCDIALVLGATAIADRADVIPAAVEALGGTVEHLGMPVDPGNLMLLAGIGPMRVLGLPGSARSPRLHGFDWVLQRLVAGIEVDGEALMRMGVGGLLKEIPSRPQPRASAVPGVTEDDDAMPGAPPRVAAIILAAGQSRRMGALNKLLAEIDGKPMVAHAADAALASRAEPVIVVTGHQPEMVAAALEGRAVEFVHNPDFADGLSTSLRHAIAALPDATRVYPGHEYMDNNLGFTLDREPDNQVARDLKEELKDQDPNHARITTLGEERQINTFLRLDSASVIAGLKEKFADLPDVPDAKSVFLKLRELRNSW